MTSCEDAVAARIREILASWPPTTEQQRSRAVAVLASVGKPVVAIAKDNRRIARVREAA